MRLKVEKKAVKKLNPREILESYTTRMEKELKDENISFYEPDKDLFIDREYLKLPASLTDITSRDLGEYLNAYTQQKLYLRTVQGRLDFRVEQKKREYLERSNNLYTQMCERKLSETAKERLITQDNNVRPIYYEYVDNIKKLGIVERAIESVEDVIFMLSREVTRRTGDFSEENRAYSVSRK